MNTIQNIFIAGNKWRSVVADIYDDGTCSTATTAKLMEEQYRTASKSERDAINQVVHHVTGKTLLRLIRDSEEAHYEQVEEKPSGTKGSEPVPEP